MAEQLTYPPGLSKKNGKALEEAVEYIIKRFDPIGIIATGSIIRDCPGPTSDLDIHTVHRLPWQQRIQKFFNGVPAEIFINPPERVRKYFEDEHRDFRPSTAHMYATGRIILDRNGVMRTLAEEAGEWLKKEPKMPEMDELSARYGIATAFEDSMDMKGEDDTACRMIMNHAVYEAVKFFFKKRRMFIPRSKDMHKKLMETEPELGDTVRRYYNSGDIDKAAAAARQIILNILASDGFFEWEGEQVKVSIDNTETC